MVTQGPRGDFNPLSVTLKAGQRLYRVSSNESGRLGNAFNPGTGKQSPTRFAFFGNPAVPVLYAAAGEYAAVSESILHDEVGS